MVGSRRWQTAHVKRDLSSRESTACRLALPTAENGSDLNHYARSRRPRTIVSGGGESSEFEERVVQINRVAKVHQGGRRFSFGSVVVVGDGKGRVGAGIGKAGEVPESIRKGVEQAKKNLIKVPLDGTTIPHEVQVKVRRVDRDAATSGAGDRRYRGWCGARGRRSGRYSRCALEVAGLEQPGQCRAGNAEGAEFAGVGGRCRTPPGKPADSLRPRRVKEAAHA